MPTLSLRSLNRSLLVRQGLLRRWDCAPETAIERLVGLQAQAPHAPYFGLWTRLNAFEPSTVGALLEQRKLVRLALQRSTLHLVTAADAVWLRSVLAGPMLRVLPRSLRDFPRFAEVVGRAAELVDAAPRTFAELGSALATEFGRPASGGVTSGLAGDELVRIARAALALVQVPPRGVWGRSGPARHVRLERWLDRALPPSPEPAELVRRYLTAFGPATAADIAAWSGLTGLKPVLAGMDLRRLRDEAERELLDVVDGLLVDGDAPAPVRILAEFDNVLLGHADRRRIFDDAHRFRFMTTNGLVRSTLLVDGFVAGHCKLRLGSDHASLTLQPYVRLPAAARRELTTEAERLLGFAAPGVRAEVTFAPL